MTKEQVPVTGKLVDVAYENDGKKAILTFVDFENGNALEVNFNKQVFDGDSEKWVDNEERAARAEEQVKEFVGTDFDHISDKEDEDFQVYRYDNFNSLWPVDVVAKFDMDDEGEIISTQISEIKDDGTAIRIRFEHEEETYESKMTYGKYVESLKQWFPNPVRHKKVLAKFKEKFGVSFDEAESLVGTDITVEVKVAFKKFPYAEIKKLKAKK